MTKEEAIKKLDHHMKLLTHHVICGDFKRATLDARIELDLTIYDLADCILVLTEKGLHFVSVD